MTIEVSKHLTSLSLDGHIKNLKVHEMIIKKDSEIVKAKRERRPLALKAKKESSDEECLTSRSEDEEYAMGVRDFKKFFKRRGRCGDPNHLIGECLKPPKDKNQRAFVGGSWSDSGEEDDEKVINETCLMAQASSEVCFESFYFSDENSSIDDSTLDSQLCDNKCRVTFSEHDSEITKEGTVIENKTRCLELLHMDLFGPFAVWSYKGNLYTLVIVDDYSRDYLTEFDPKSYEGVFLDEEEAIKVTEKKNLENDIEDETLEIDEIVNIKESRNHPLKNVIGNLNQRTLRNKLDENGVVSRNKDRLVVQGYNQQEGIDYDETYAPVARLDIMFIICLCARFQEDPKTSHLEAVKRIFRYIKGTTHLKLWYPKGTGIETIVYVDSNHAGDYVDRKSTSDICTFVGCCLTSWFLKKQTALAISTTEAEYVSAGKTCQQALLMKQALIDYNIRLDDVPIMCHNK
nr:copia protein [Tanacetum cinerariifolium]